MFSNLRIGIAQTLYLNSLISYIYDCKLDFNEQKDLDEMNETTAFEREKTLGKLIWMVK